MLDEKGEREEAHRTDRSKCFLNHHAVQSCQCVKLAKRKKTNEEENHKIGPLAVDDATNNDGCAEQCSNNTLSKIAEVFKQGHVGVLSGNKNSFSKN